MRRDVEACLLALRQVHAEKDLPARVVPSQLPFHPPSSSPLYYLELAKQKLAENDAQGALEAAEAAVWIGAMGIHSTSGCSPASACAWATIGKPPMLLATYDRGYPVETHHRLEVLERLGQL